ncbi:hypothetical protein T440DRAFT_473744 [Plenodomus tracheiphilus IPT5]|uniref:Transcription factor domain-containing protein n=1 Tax=Plenodomus tracheiphilus IPT5 TaxID=1408161 RepID=A0A6A7AMV8_9PLEO|nr:hypothetical protein T440DRAFT_473744 [Plenodomus tracheiphilus IPT5]
MPEFDTVRSLRVQSVLSGFGTAGVERGPLQSVEYVASLGDNFSDNTAPWSKMIPMRISDRNEKLFKNLAISEPARERILVVAQTFFRLALDRLSISSNPGYRFLVTDRKKHSSSTVLLLPPTASLSIFLSAFVTSFEPFFPMFSQRLLNLDAMDWSSREELPVLFLLLMFSYGAMRDSALRARRLSIGLLEISRLALFNILDKDNATPKIQMTSQCALVCMYQSAFSGHKWLVDSSLGQMQMYMSMAKQFGIFNGEKLEWSSWTSDLDEKEVWPEWMERETCSRLAHCWAIIDQEVSLLHDLNPALTLVELGTSLPEGDDLWLANDASSWSKCWNERPAPDFPPLSLQQLFGLLLENKIDNRERRLSILHMRLLLYPLHIMISQLCESLSYSSKKLYGRISKPVSQVLTTLRFEEINSLRRTWYNLILKLEPTNIREQALKQSALIIFHLLSLRMAVSFPQLERCFREVAAHSRIVHDLLETGIQAAEEAVVHCGQVLRLIRGMETDLRPLWWPAAAYRATVILYALGTSAPALNPSTTSEVPIDVAIDVSSLDDYTIRMFLKYGTGRPCLTCEDGALAPIKDVNRILHICIDLLRQSVRGSFLAEELIQRLESVANLEARDSMEEYYAS